jgi:UPF0755 protein
VRRLLVIGVVLLAAGAAAAGLAYRYLTSPLPGLTQPVTVLVQDGDSVLTVARRLNQAGVLEQPWLFAQWARLDGKAERIQTGEYELRAAMTPAAVLDLLVSGRVKLYPVTLLEGWTWRDVRDAMRSNPVLESRLGFASAESLAAELELSAAHAEGLFFPDTYMIPRGTTDRQLLRQAAELMQQQLAAAWADRDPDLPLATSYELLILASIIERETALASERAQVAGVFVRRLQKNMRLQTDPTVIYGLGDAFDGDLRRADLRADTPYNTYTRGGLPPTPIALPGAAALRAAARPAGGDALYFVATGEADGSHVFSATLAEHNAAVSAYLARLRRQPD